METELPPPQPPLMATVTVEINGRPYAVGCADGQEERVRLLAQQFDGHVRQVAGEVGLSSFTADPARAELGVWVAVAPRRHTRARKRARVVVCARLLVHRLRRVDRFPVDCLRTAP